MKNYDVWFTLEQPALLVVEAKSAEDAKEIAEEMLVDMDYDELMRRIGDAVDYMGVKVVAVEDTLE